MLFYFTEIPTKFVHILFDAIRKASNMSEIISDTLCDLEHLIETVIDEYNDQSGLNNGKDF